MNKSVLRKTALISSSLRELRVLRGEQSSPDWHGDVLAERARLIVSGEEKFVDWETAKRQTREELLREHGSRG